MIKQKMLPAVKKANLNFRNPRLKSNAQKSTKLESDDIRKGKWILFLQLLLPHESQGGADFERPSRSRAVKEWCKQNGVGCLLI